MSLAVLAPPLSIRSGPATRYARFAQGFLGASALILAMACGGGGGGGGSTTPVVPPPVATSLTASAASPAFGSTFTLTPVYSAGTGAIDNGVTCPASGAASAPVTANWAGAKTFTLTVTNSANVTATTTAVVTPQVVSVGAITPAAPSVTVSTTKSFTTTVTGGALNTVTWSASAGTFAGNVWTAPATPGTVTITATSVDDPTKTATTTATVVAAPSTPVATSLTASTTTPAYGATFTLTPVYSGGTGTLNNGVTCPATGVASAAITANWTGARTFTLTVDNGAGSTATKSVTVTPQVVSVGAISPAASTKTVSSTTSFSSTVTGGALNTVTWSASAGSFAGNVWTAPATPGPVTITATADDDHSKTATTTVTVVAAAVATSLTASTTTPAYGATFTLTPVYSGGTGTLNNGVTCPATGVASAAITANWTGARTFTLTVDNGAGSTATKSVTVTPQVVSVGAVSPATPTKTVSTTTTFSTTVTGGALNSVTWSASAGSFAGNVWTAPATPGPVTITATADDDHSKTATTTVTVVAAPQITAFTAGASRVVVNGNTTLAATFTGGTGSVNHSVGAILGDGTTVSTGTLATTTVFTLTVTNAANDAVTQTATVTVGNDLTVNITGLGALTGDVTVTGPSGFSQHLTASQTFNGLEDGTYTVTANTVTDSSQPGLGGALGSAHLQRYPLVRVQTQALSAAGSDPATATLVANYPAATLTVAAGSTSIDMVLVPGGTYTMGESETTIGSEAVALPPHSVTLAKAFYVAKVPVTQAQWSALMSGNPSDFVDPAFPVTNVSFDDVTAPTTGFLDRLNAAASAKPTGSTFRLPTDAEFEYATRAGTTTNFYFGSYDTGVPADQSVVDTYVWSTSNSAGAIHPAGALLPNAWGLYDMSGLIWQLCQDDWHADYAASGPGIPALPVNGSAWVDSPRPAGRVYRGGSWAGAPWQAQSKFRGPYNHDDASNNNAGFRVVLQLP